MLKLHVFFALFLLISCKTTIQSDDATAKQAASTSGGATSGDCSERNALAKVDRNGEQVFNLTENCLFNNNLHEVRIRIHGKTLERVLKEGCADTDSGYGHVIQLTLDGMRIDNVGIKVCGNTSKCNEKRQFKFKFDVEEAFSADKTETVKFPENKDRKIFGMEGLSLRSSEFNDRQPNDPSMARERLATRLFTAAEGMEKTAERGGLVYRVGFAKVFISLSRKASEGREGFYDRLLDDGFYYNYRGLYSLAENLDKVFLNTRFQVNDEKLKDFYLFQADKGKGFFERARYSRKGWAVDYVDGKKVESEDQSKKADAKILGLIDLLEKNPAPDEKALADVIDIENIVNYTSAAILAGHWDSMLANANNDFLFFNGAKKKWQIITWDLDNTLGAQKALRDKMMTENIFSPASSNKAKLITTIFASDKPNFRKNLQGRLKAYIDGPASEKEFGQAVDTANKFIRKNTEAWEKVPDSGFTDIKNFVKARRDKTKSQL